MRAKLPTTNIESKEITFIYGHRAILHVIATDPGAIKDFEAFSNQTGNKLMDSKEDSGKFYFLIEKA